MDIAFKKIERNANFEVNLDQLDDSQRAAVESEAPNVVIRASAGAGKTKTLITAVANYRYEHLNDRICAITYTRAARAEMEERLRGMGVYDVEVTTIHVWARNLLHEYGLKYDFKVRILEENDIKTILMDIAEDYRLRHQQTRMKININILYSFVSGNKLMDVSDGYKRMLQALEAEYIKYKRQNGLYDFTDYPLYLYDVMKFYDEYVTKIDALFVDEFQDIDTIQFETFKRVLAKKKFFIGDKWQSIFLFRDADGEVFDKLEDFDRHKLKYNYRSYQEIVDYACTVYETLYPLITEGSETPFISSVQYLTPSKVICSRGTGGEVTIVDQYKMLCYNNGMMTTLDTDSEMKNEFNQFITEDGGPMILCRTNKQVKAIQEYGFTNVSTVHQAKGLEYDKVIVIDSEIKNIEDLNVAYVALTRAKNSLMVIDFTTFEWLLNKKNSFYR